ncbi:unnamed protein product [Peniophora sp. CBMAI 1063]|nr:unnamed protein product [Peniophora sp. CBMAI 1063]
MVHFDNPEPFTPTTPSTSRRPSEPVAPHRRPAEPPFIPEPPESLQPDTVLEALAAMEPHQMPNAQRRKSSAAIFRGLEHDFDTQAEDLPEEFRTTHRQPQGRERKPGAVFAHYAAEQLRRASSVVGPQIASLVPEMVRSAAGAFHDAHSEMRSGTVGFPRIFKGREYRPFVPTVRRSKQLGVPDANGNFLSRLGPKNGHLDDSNSEDDDEETNLRYKLGPVQSRRKFVLRLAKALMTYGAPSHRIEEQLNAACDKLKLRARLAYLPNIIIVAFSDEASHTDELHFVRSSGSRISLTFLRIIHDIYRDVLHYTCSPDEGSRQLAVLLKAPPIYPLALRCFFSLISSSVICALAFDGSVVDMGVSGALASFTQYLGLTLAAKSSVYANVYEISAAMFVSFAARGLSSIPGRIFCYSAISSGGVVPLLPGYIVLTSALELTQRSIIAGAVRLVYAIIYTFFLGFSMTIGSDVFLLFYPKGNALTDFAANAAASLDYVHGVLTAPADKNSGHAVNFTATFGFKNETLAVATAKACFRGPEWPWPFLPSLHWPWWRYLILVPAYATAISLSNLQSYRSWRLIVMVGFACVAYLVNTFAHRLVGGPSIDVASALAAAALGTMGNIQSRIFGGTAFTSMVPGVLFLVPSGLAQGGGLAGNSDSGQISDSFALGMRMINVAIGVTIGLSVSQTIVYAVGRRKSGGHMAF